MNLARERFCTCSDFDLSWLSRSSLFLLPLSFPLVTWGQKRVCHCQPSHWTRFFRSCIAERRENPPPESWPGSLLKAEGRAAAHTSCRWSLKCPGLCQQHLWLLGEARQTSSLLSCHQDESIHTDVWVTGVKGNFLPFPHSTESHFRNTHGRRNSRRDAPGAREKVHLKQVKDTAVLDGGWAFPPSLGAYRAVQMPLPLVSARRAACNYKEKRCRVWDGDADTETPEKGRLEGELPTFQHQQVGGQEGRFFGCTIPCSAGF